ncbi:hypothetical protein M422DRAFT_73278 [Sphaerobolus stellatus SS14]|nr:hypothetical protein M422DRAFT_73278 [Sphaerobolus stellatus SS14]
MSNIPPDPPDPPQIPNGSLETSGIIPATSANRLPRNPASSGRGRGRGNGRGRSQRPNTNTPGDAPLNTSSGERNNHRRRRAPRENVTVADETVPSSHRNLPRQDDDAASRHSDGSTRSRKSRISNKEVNEQNVSQPGQPGPSRNSKGGPRRERFGGQLSEQNERPPRAPKRPKTPPPPDSDLTTRLIYALRTPPFPDCPICFNPLHPAQPTWSCSLSEEVSSCCWATFHLKCVREWARKSVKDVKDAFVARGQIGEEGYWRCPGCQTKRTYAPRTYQCFCGAVADPKPGIATPHSCGLTCSRKRKTCDHPCPLNCHPGPCPPCILTVTPPCYCGKTEMAMRCVHTRAVPEPSLSCGQTCGRQLTCGNHVCEAVCHPGDCTPCSKTETINCFCGKHTKEVPCGEGLLDKQEALVIETDGQMKAWVGRYACEDKCERPFACGHHSCSKQCHTPSPTPTQCPFDPSLITQCPCGKHSLDELQSMLRMSCTDPIPTCNSTCGKPLEDCSHSCASKCHLGPCPPCIISVTVMCRCGGTTRYISCRERQKSIAQGDEVVLCDKVCTGLRLCGRHQCSRVCCPLATLSRKTKGKKGKSTMQHALREIELEDQEQLWHECDLICGKMLSCGTHRCSEPDHRGACPPCLQSSFEELSCHCGRTVLLPPIPCGTQINCPYPCNRPPPPCGHARASHTCHEDHIPCPPCPFLTTKRCACGKSNVNNVRCSQEKVSCGQPCGKLLDCGFHKCQRSCHSDMCGPCPSVCGKPRKLCLPAHHACTHSCHAPSACDEDEPCDTVITVSCSCGRFQQPMKCGKCTANPNKASPQLPCRDECAIAKRNARLAEALGITDTKKKVDVTYSDELVSFGKANGKFLPLVEKTLYDFVCSNKKNQVLPYMPENRRKFVRELCQLYRIDTQLVDQEPRRSIQLHRRIDTRVPNPTLTASITTQSSAPNFGKLADLRTVPPVRATPASSLAPTPAPAVRSTMPAGRGWTSVVAAAPQSGSSNPRTPSVQRTIPGGAASNARTPVRENWDDD